MVIESTDQVPSPTITGRPACSTSGDKVIALDFTADYNCRMAQEAIPFDTHRFVRNLVAGGFTERQAEVLADEQIQLINSNLATKADIEALRLSTTSDIEALRLSTTSDIEALRLSTTSDIETLRLSTEAKIESAKFEIVKWLIGAMIAQGTLIVGLTVALNKLL